MKQDETLPKLPPLSPAAASELQKITSGEFLGASRNIRQINELFVTLCSDRSVSSGKDLVEQLLVVGNYLALTRGKNTPAIGNAIHHVLKDMEKQADQPPGRIREMIAERQEAFNALSILNKNRMAEFGANLLADCQTVFAFDYSSTMLAVLGELANRGRRIKLIVPESRVLDGGRPIANEATDQGHSVQFIIDLAFATYLHQSDAILIGAETIFANGDCWNTIGSYPIAALAHLARVPYYVATELIKIDPQSYLGIKKSMVLDDYSRLLQHPQTFRHPELVSTTGPEMDHVSGDLITSYITPRGIMLPEHIHREGLHYLESINVYILPD